MLQPPLANIGLGFRSSLANPSGPPVSFKRSNYPQHLLHLQTQGESKNPGLQSLAEFSIHGVILPPSLLRIHFIPDLRNHLPELIPLLHLFKDISYHCE